MKSRIVLIITCVMIACLQAMAADDASQLLAKSAERFRSSKSIKANYTMTTVGTGAVKGSVIFSGDKFAMTSPDMMTWYDGTTQWTYIVSNQEVNVTEPTAEELQQINPFVIINQFRKSYTAKLLSSTAGTKKIQLTAKNAKIDIASAVVSLNASTMLPSAITLTLRNKQMVNIVISGLSQGASLPITTFQFPSAKYPKVEIVDLR